MGVVAGLAGLLAFSTLSAQSGKDAPLLLATETRLSNIRQLTFGGENAEAYFSFDGKKLTYQSTGE